MARVIVWCEIAGCRGKERGMPFFLLLNPLLVPGYSDPGHLFISLGRLRAVLDVVGLKMDDWLGEVSWASCKWRPSELSVLPQAFTDDYRANRPGRSLNSCPFTPPIRHSGWL